MLLIACSSSFAQKNELKDLERLVNRKNTTEATVVLEKVEAMLNDATEDQKAAYYFYKAQNEINLANSGVAFNENRQKAIQSINQLIKFENETKSKKYTTEILPIKNTLLASLVDDAIDNNRNKNYKNSSRLFEQAYILNTNDTIYLYHAASDAINAKDFDFAETKLKQLVKLNYNGKSQTYVASSQTTGDVQSFGSDKKARDLAVKSGTHTKPETIFNNNVKPEIYTNLTHILLNKQNYTEAEAYALEAYNLDKNNINNLLNILFLYYNTNRLDQYQKFAKEGVERFPENESLLYNLAVIHVQNNENEEANKYLNRILQLNPQNFDALKAFGNLELQKDADVTNKINALPNTAASDKKRAELMNEKKLIYQTALDYYTKAQEINNKDEGLNELISQIQNFLSNN